MRPSGKRQVAGQATTARATSASTTPEVVETRSNPFTAIADYLRGVISEMRKVIWPTAQQMITYTLVVFAFLIVLTVLVAGVDFLAGAGVEWALTWK